uniref:Uncharacterized protein n=1 Tax=Arundo donax TaxID=35708 RepID=A0A0A8YNB9_ARUDO
MVAPDVSNSCSIESESNCNCISEN